LNAPFLFLERRVHHGEHAGEQRQRRRRGWLKRPALDRREKREEEKEGGLKPPLRKRKQMR